MEEYLAAKARLFAVGRSRRGVVTIDDEWGRKLAERVEIPIETVSAQPDAGLTADWRVTSANVGLDGVGSTFTFTSPDGSEHTGHSPLPGLVNVSNAIVAIAAASAWFGEGLRLVEARNPATARRIEARLVELEASPGGVGPEALVDGDDLIAAGLEPGPMFGKWLDAVYDAQLEGRVRSKDDALRLALKLASGAADGIH